MSTETKSPDLKRVLIVDDEESVLNTLKRLFRNHPYAIRTALRAKEALALLEEESADLIISDMRMPEMDGAEFLAIAKEKYPLTERILLTGYSDMDSTVKAINDGGIFGYISKPWNVESLQSLVENALDQTHKNRLKNRTLKRFKRTNDALEENIARTKREMAQSAEFVDHAFQRLRDNHIVTEQMLINLLDMKCPGQRDVSMNMRHLAEQVSGYLGLSEEESLVLSSAAALHGIGKIGIPDSILVKTQLELSPDELAHYQKYPSLWASTLMGYPGFEDVAQVIFEQREYIDGSGYPSQLKDNEMSRLGRLLSLLLDYCELRNGVMTGQALTHDQALSQIEENSHRYDDTFLPTLGCLTMEVSAVEFETEMMMPLFSLREGMVLSRDVFSDAEVMLLPRGARLTEALIGNLMNVERNSEHPILVSVRFPVDK